jgi:hypothetical protein
MTKATKALNELIQRIEILLSNRSAGDHIILDEILLAAQQAKKQSEE